MRTLNEYFGISDERAGQILDIVLDAMSKFDTIPEVIQFVLGRVRPDEQLYAVYVIGFVAGKSYVLNSLSNIVTASQAMEYGA